MTTKTCRLCLRKEGQFYGLFDIAKSESLRIVDEINHVLNIRIYEDEKLPRSICTNCYKILTFFKEFRLSCLRVNNFLLEQIEIWGHLNEDNFLQVIKSAEENQVTNPKYIKPSQLITEHAEQENFICGKDNECPNMRLSNFIFNARRYTYNSQTSNNIYWGDNNDSQNEDLDEMPPLVRADAMHFTRSHIIKPDLEIKNTLIKKGENISMLPEVIIVEEPNVEKCLPEANTFEGSGLWNDDEEHISEECNQRNNNELVAIDKVLSIPENNSPVISPEIKEQGSDGQNESTMGSSNCCNSMDFGEYLLKNEEIILSESECDAENLSDCTEELGDDLLHEQDQNNTEIVDILNSSSSMMSELVIKQPVKNIHNCETDFNKATLDALLTIQNNGINLSYSIIKQTAQKLAAEHGLPKFTASKGWLISFYKRFNIEPDMGEIIITPKNLQARPLSNRFIIRYCCDEVNESTFQACKDILNSGAELSGKLIKHIASNIALDEGLFEFIATTGWLNSFRRKYIIDLKGRKMSMIHLGL